MSFESRNASIGHLNRPEIEPKVEKKMLRILSLLKLGFAISPSFEIISPGKFMGGTLGTIRNTNI